MPNFIRAENSPINSSLQRFDARYFTLNFRTGSVATVVANSANVLTLNAQFRSNIDLVGLFWNSADTYGHPLLKYVSDKNYTGCIFAFVANFLDPYNASLTINSGSKSYIYRIFPYKISGSSVVPNVTNALVQGSGPGLSYTTTTIFPSGVTVPGGYQIYVVDFSHLQQGYNYDQGVIPCNSIDTMFFAVVPTEYGLGGSATLDNASNSNLTTWNISGVPNGFRTQAGDVFVVSYTVGTQFFSQEVIVTTYTQTSSTLHLTMSNPITGATWTGGPVTAKVLSLDSAIGDVALQFNLQNISVTGSRTSIGKYNYPQAVNGIQMATGYDDSYNITPWRQAHQIYDLGYRGDIVCYMGASHYYQSDSTLVSGVYYNTLTTSASTPLNTPTVAWCTSLFAELSSLGLGFIWSTSLEILLSAIPQAWAQKDYQQNLAKSGYTPPTSFMSPSSSDAQTYLISVIKQGLSLMQAAGLTLKFQLGEFWWWDGSYQNLQPCIYDNTALLLYNAETGNFAPQDPISPAINTSYIYNSNQSLTAAQTTYANWLGGQLGVFTKAVKDGVKVTYSGSQCCLLFFSPQIFAISSTLLPIINFPSSAWKYSTGDYDFMQIEDYDWVIAGQIGRLPLTLQAATGTGTLPNGQDELGYPLNKVDYFIGFVPDGSFGLPLGSNPGETGSFLEVWDYCSIALQNAIAAGITVNRVWAYPQIIRDGIVISALNYIEPKFPLPQSFFVLPKPEFNTVLDASEGDLETRINSWGGLARYEFTLQSRDILPTTIGDLKSDFNALVAFFFCVSQGKNQIFRTRKGVFRLNCQTDNSAIGQVIGTGDGVTTNYSLIKTYSYDSAVYTRIITKPNAQPNIYLNSVLQTSGYYCDLFSGVISFATPPANTVVISADFTFDFPVRFVDEPFPFTIDMDFNSFGFDDITFIEDMESINTASAEFGTSSESIFPLSQSYLGIGKPKSKSSFISTEGGKQTRYSSYGSRLLYEFTLQARDILPVDVGTSLGDFNKAINFFLCIAQGQANSFRFKYSADYSMTGQVIGAGDGITTTFQIIKTYQVGSLTYTRIIKKPIVGTVTPHWSSGTFTFSVDYTTGLITFGTAPGIGITVTCDFQFHFLVRFSENKLPVTLDMDFGSYGFEDLVLVEVRE